jgi:ribonuclease P protein component
MRRSAKKKLKKAVDRNKAKRLIREAYRKNKEELIKLLEKSPFEMHISIIYTANEILSYQEIESKIIAMIIRLKNNLNNQKNA